MITYRRLSLPRGAIAQLLIINAVLFLAAWIFGIPSAWLGVPSQAILLLQRPWTLLTYMFTHYSLWHLLVNMLWLWMFGRILEYVTSGTRVWSIYIVAGLGGALLYVVCGSLAATQGILCGASAAVTGIMAAAGLYAPDMPVNLMFFGRVKLKWIVVAGVVLLFIGAGGSGFFAHFGGLAAGAAMVWMPRHGMGISLRRFTRWKRELADHRKGRRLRHALKKRQQDMNRLNQLLDRVRLSGFNSLSKSEREELKQLSQRLSPPFNNE